MTRLRAGGHELEYVWVGPAPDRAPTLVFLHEGLGSVSTWRDVPAVLSARTGCGVLVYSRWGHGRSDPLNGSRAPTFMHDEALVTLPDVLAALHVRQPILVGHSDGGSIAIIYAGAAAGPLLALVLEAPHVFVEDLSVESITRIKTTYETTELTARLARHHGDNTDAMFRGWNDVWLSPEFRDWNIEAWLPSIRCPILVIQGEDDEYGTMRQVEAIEAGAAGPVEAVRLAACGHAPHVDQREQALDAITRFIAARRAPGGPAVPP